MIGSSGDTRFDRDPTTEVVVSFNNGVIFGDDVRWLNMCVSCCNLSWFSLFSYGLGRDAVSGKVLELTFPWVGSPELIGSPDNDVEAICGTPICRTPICGTYYSQSKCSFFQLS